MAYRILTEALENDDEKHFNWRWPNRNIIKLLRFQINPLSHIPLSINSLHWHLHLSSLYLCLLLQHLTVCFCRVTYVFQSEPTLYSCLNVKELLARSRYEIWSLDFAPASRKEFLDIQATTECGFSLKHIRDTQNIQSNAPYR